MKKYVVIKPLMYEGHHTKEGEFVNLSDANAAHLTGRIALVGDAEPAKETAKNNDPNTNDPKGNKS